MKTHDSVILSRDVDAAVVPIGTKVTLLKGETAYITQALGGYTVVVNGNMFRVDAKDADALGIQADQTAKPTGGTPRTLEALEKEVWTQMKGCYDPEIPVNVVDLGLIYDCTLTPVGAGDTYRAEVKMTLTAPGCGMGPTLAADVQSRLLGLEEIDEANVELVWDPPWNQGMMTEAAKLQLGLL